MSSIAMTGRCPKITVLRISAYRIELSATAATATAKIRVRLLQDAHTIIYDAKLTNRAARLISLSRCFAGRSSRWRTRMPLGRINRLSRAAGGTGRRARLRGVWGNPSGFESRVAHQHDA